MHSNHKKKDYQLRKRSTWLNKSGDFLKEHARMNGSKKNRKFVPLEERNKTNESHRNTDGSINADITAVFDRSQVMLNPTIHLNSPSNMNSDTLNESNTNQMVKKSPLHHHESFSSHSQDLVVVRKLSEAHVATTGSNHQQQYSKNDSSLNHFALNKVEQKNRGHQSHQTMQERAMTTKTIRGKEGDYPPMLSEGMKDHPDDFDKIAYEHNKDLKQSIESVSGSLNQSTSRITKRYTASMTLTSNTRHRPRSYSAEVSTQPVSISSQEPKNPLYKLSTSPSRSPLPKSTLTPTTLTRVGLPFEVNQSEEENVTNEKNNADESIHINSRDFITPSMNPSKILQTSSSISNDASNEPSSSPRTYEPIEEMVFSSPTPATHNINTNTGTDTNTSTRQHSNPNQILSKSPTPSISTRAKTTSSPAILASWERMTQVPFQYEIYYSDDKAFKQVLEEVNSSLSYIFDENDYAISLKNDMSVLSVESKLVTSAKILGKCRNVHCVVDDLLCLF